jgi:hypothetical protein
MMSTQQSIVDSLNRHCQCVGTNIAALHTWLDADLSQRGMNEPIATNHPHLFSELPVFLSREHAKSMQRVIAAIESVIQLPVYQQTVLKQAPMIAQATPAARGVFLGYDFHLTSDGPKLIEINTNAGGALLNVATMRAQQACCPEVKDYLDSQPNADVLENTFFAMFLQEWHLSRPNQELRRIAIVDENPQTQYLYPEFLLFQRLFESRGVRAIIASPEQLQYRSDSLWVDDQRIDLVYNRLTDFYLQEPNLAALANAYHDNAVVLTPHPNTHALYANKHNLVVLSDEHALRSLNVPEETIQVLCKGIPMTKPVSASGAEYWWNDRKQWFFKPASGFGSRGTYRGDKLTRKVFDAIIHGDYVAQRFASPAERWQTEAADSALKFDIRNYVYAGETQLIAARLYQGQTTNFRTPGGGFAPVYCL